MPPSNGKPPQSLAVILSSAGKKALGGGISGALAMVVQVVALMWMRTTINFQHKYGMSTKEALNTLYSQGGIARFYQGMTAALLQAPLSRFGDTASYAGMTALLETVDMPQGLKTLCASLSAAIFRIGITPIDTFKTTMQVEGAAGVSMLRQRVADNGLMTLYSGSLGSSFATLVGHYPWFLTYDMLQKIVPPVTGGVAKQVWDCPELRCPELLACCRSSPAAVPRLLPLLACCRSSPAAAPRLLHLSHASAVPSSRSGSCARPSSATSAPSHRMSCPTPFVS